MFDLSDKNVVLTGATGYLGRYMCEAFLSQGAKLTMIARSEKRLQQLFEKYSHTYGTDKISYKKADCYDLNEFEECLSSICAKSSAHVLINNAFDLSKNTGFNCPEGMLEASSYAQWEKSFQSGIYWAVLSSQVLGKHFIDKKIQGSIINIGSMYGVVAPTPSLYEGTELLNPPTYGVTKAGLIALTRYTASFWGKYGIRCNCLSPGPFVNIEDGPNTAERDNFIKKLGSKTALGRVAHPKELSGALIYLASDESSYLTGHNLIIDGGWTII